MTEKIRITLPKGSEISKNINKVGNDLGKLIDNGNTEKIYKINKNSNIKI